MCPRSATPPYYDPYDADIDANPYPVWKRLRDEAPLYYNAEHDFYALSRFADVHAASLDWQTFSSARGTVLEIIDTSPTEADDVDDAFPMMIFMDPPRHDELRRLVSRAFTPRRVASLESRARELCSQFLDPLRGGGGFDYVEEFAAKIPTMIIGAMLGVPDEDQDQLRIWGDQMLRFEPEGISAGKLDAIQHFGAYMEEMVDDRRRTPRDDMVSDLLASEITREDGSTRRLDHREVMAFFTLLEIAGSETTARLLGWASVLLARHPDQRAKLRADEASSRTPWRNSYGTSPHRRSKPASSPARLNGTDARSRPTRNSRYSPAAPAATNANTPTPTDST